MKILFLVLTLLLTSCATTSQIVDQSTAVKYKYVIITIPDDMLAIPTPERSIDPNVATDKDAARWMIDWEKRYQEIEKKLKLIKTFQDQKLNELKLPPEDVIKN